jgi:hypothetical protein
MDTCREIEFINKRRFFRIYLKKPICTETSIVNLNGKSIKTNPANICVNDIGIGSLQFSSKLNLPLGNNIIYEFKINILHKCYYFRGSIVWKNEKENGEIAYGVNFQLDNNDIPNYFTIFNDLALIVRRSPKRHGCNFCDIRNCPNVSL